MVLLFLVCAAYSNSLGGGFHFDDQAIFLDTDIMSSGFGWRILRFMQTRPLTFLTFHWNYLASGVAPFGFHAVNIVLHAANTILVLLIARLHLRGSLALLAAAIFAVHPLQTQAINYVFERATLLAAFFALLSLLFFVRENYAWAVAAFGLSMLAKEETIALPAVLLLYDFVFRRRIRWGFYASMSGLAALATVRLFYVLQKMPEAKLGFGKGIPGILYALTQCRVVWVYLRLFFFPAGLNLDHHIELSQGPATPLVTLPALFLLVLLIGVLGWLTWRRTVPAFWALGFFVLLAPSSSVVPVVDLMFEHRTYFPLACFTIAAACLVDQWHWSLRVWALVVLVAALLAGTIARNGVWHDERSLWTDVIEKSPGKARGYFLLGQAFASQDPARARQLYERGLAIEQNPLGETNLGLLLMAQNDLEGALVHLRQALHSDGRNALIWNNVGAVELRRGHLEDGIKALRTALEIDPCRFDARMNLMRALSVVKQRDNAVLAGLVPATCHQLPEQARQLADEQKSLR